MTWLQVTAAALRCPEMDSAIHAGTKARWFAALEQAQAAQSRRHPISGT